MARRAAYVAPPEADAADERSLSELLTEATDDLRQLLRKEIELAKVEVQEQVSRLSKAAIFFTVTGLVAMLAITLLSFAAAWGLAEVMPTGVAFTIVGVVYVAIAGVCFTLGRSRLAQFRAVPEQTVETLKEDVAWAREQMK